MDSVDATETLARRMAIGFDVDFVALDATVIGHIRAIDAPDGPPLNPDARQRFGPCETRSGLEGNRHIS